MNTRGIHFEHRPFRQMTPQEIHDVLKLRSDVFLMEQGITAEPDIDGLDLDAIHVLGFAADGRLVATARLRMDSSPIRVARIVVEKSWRNRGLGRALMAHIHGVIGPRTATMSAQEHLVPWYEALGWSPHGDVYDEADVPHRRLVRQGVGPA